MNTKSLAIGIVAGVLVVLAAIGAIAQKVAGIEATVDYTTGKVSLSSNFLFDSGSCSYQAKIKDFRLLP